MQLNLCDTCEEKSKKKNNALLTKTVSQPASNWLSDHPTKGQHCDWRERFFGACLYCFDVILSVLTCKNNAHSKGTDAKLFSKDWQERSDRGGSCEDEEEVALCGWQMSEILDHKSLKYFVLPK